MDYLRKKRYCSRICQPVGYHEDYCSLDPASSENFTEALTSISGTEDGSVPSAEALKQRLELHVYLCVACRRQSNLIKNRYIQQLQ